MTAATTRNNRNRRDRAARITSSKPNPANIAINNSEISPNRFAPRKLAYPGSAKYRSRYSGVYDPSASSSVMKIITPANCRRFGGENIAPHSASTAAAGPTYSVASQKYHRPKYGNRTASPKTPGNINVKRFSG